MSYKGAISSILYDEVVKKNADDKVATDKRLAVSVARDLLLLEELKKKLTTVFSKGWVTPAKYVGKRVHSPHKRIVNLLLSDLHFGSHLTSTEVPYEYNIIQESRRLGRIAVQTSDYKRQYRKESKLAIHLLGDVIQGQLHDPRDGDPLTHQFAASVYYLVQFILFQCSQYPSVEVYCTPGNHGRNMMRHPDRAVNQKWDSIETMIYVAVKMAVMNSKVSNCKFFIPRTPYYTAKLLNNNGFFTHGDTVLKPGYPGRSIDVRGLAQQVTKWNTARGVGGPFNLFACGHVHFGSITNLPGNVAMITNGCLVPPDAFSLSIGAPDVTCGQYLFETTEDHVVGDQRFIQVDSADNESFYNDIIKQFPGHDVF